MSALDLSTYLESFLNFGKTKEANKNRFAGLLVFLRFVEKDHSAIPFIH